MTITVIWNVANDGTPDTGWGATAAVRSTLWVSASDANILEDQIRITVSGPPGTCNIAHMSVGKWDDAYDIANTLKGSATAVPTPVTFDGGSATKAIGGSVVAVSDWINFSGTLVLGTSSSFYGIVIPINFSGDIMQTSTGVNGNFNSSFSDTVTWQTRAGINNGQTNRIALVTKVEVQDVVATPATIGWRSRIQLGH